MPGRVVGTLHQDWGGCQARRTVEDRGERGEGGGVMHQALFFSERHQRLRRNTPRAGKREEGTQVHMRDGRARDGDRPRSVEAKETDTAHK